jgi:hypothetical protein
VYPATDVVSAVWAHDEVEVIGHQARREKLDRQSLLSVADQADEGGIVRGHMEYGAAIVATIDDVITATSNDRPGPPRHADTLRGLAGSRRSQIGREAAETADGK